jgi:hypothetical protein
VICIGQMVIPGQKSTTVPNVPKPEEQCRCIDADTVASCNSFITETVN